MNKNPHMQPGHVNTKVLDHDSDVTGYGKHNRLQVYGSVKNDHIVIVETSIGLTPATEEQRIKHANSPKRRIHPKRTQLIFSHKHEYLDSMQRPAIEYYYNIVKA